MLSSTMTLCHSLKEQNVSALSQRMSTAYVNGTFRDAVRGSLLASSRPGCVVQGLKGIVKFEAYTQTVSVNVPNLPEAFEISGFA